MKNSIKTSPLHQIEAFLKAGDYASAWKLAERLQGALSTRLAVMASIALKEGDVQKAEVLFERALRDNPNDALARTNLAKLLIQGRKFKQALAHIEVAERLTPGQESISLAHAASLSELDRIGSAISILEPYRGKESSSPNLYVTLSALLRAHLKPEEALEVLTEAKEKHPDSELVERAFADVYAELDPFVAQAEYQKVAMKHDSVTLRWNRSFVELRVENYELGWELYENGLSSKVGRIGRPLPAQVKRLPLVTELDALDPTKWTFFSSEQGIGDQVLFYGSLSQALERCPKALLICEERMLPVLRRSFPTVEVYPYAFAQNFGHQLQRINGVFPIGSLMKSFRRSRTDFEQHRDPYILVNHERSNKYRNVVRARFQGQKVIGISWRGGYWDRQVRTKSFEFELLVKTLASQPNVRLLCLQYGDVSAEKALSEANQWPVTFINGIDFKKDIEGWLALADTCDHIVSVSTALVHFMGAINKRVELLVGDRQAPFIWGTGTGTSIPYASVNIHRKDIRESAEDYMSRVAPSLV